MFNNNVYIKSTYVFCWGLGLSISFPESSQDMLKSVSTCLARDVIKDVAITFLWTPVISNITINKNNNNN